MPGNQQYEVRRRSSLLLTCFATLVVAGITRGEDFATNEPPQVALPSQRLMMEQVEELIAAGEFEEAIDNLEKLFDLGTNHVVPMGDEQRAATLIAHPYQPVRVWIRSRLAKLLIDQPAVREQYHSRYAEIARTTLAEVAETKDTASARRAAERYSATPSGPELELLLADLYQERGWSLAVIQSAQRVSEDLRQSVGKDSKSQGSLPWSLIWRKDWSSQQRSQFQKAFGEVLKQPTVSGKSRQELLAQALVRVILASAIDPQTVDYEAAVRWGNEITGVLETNGQSTRVAELVDQSRSWVSPESDSAWSTFAGMNSRSASSSNAIRPKRWPSWTQTLDRYSATSDRTAASKPRAGESERGILPYHPVVQDGRIYVGGLTRIYAYDLKTGKVWPDARPARPLFDSQIGSSAYMPLGYPLVGAPRGTLSIDNGALYARMGSPVTGWANKEVAADGGSISYLVGLDLERQGSLLPGFPLRLLPPEFEGSEFEGAPVIWGDLLFVAIVSRDNVGLRRSVAAFNRVSGELHWRSGALASGNVAGSDRSNLISHQLLTLAGGRLFYNTNLGSIACLDPLTGRIEWLTQYTSTTKRASAIPRPDRFRYRDLTPCLVAKGLVYCAPQDCPEVFALDATTGDLVWSTDDQQTADAIHLLGISGESLIASGDRLIWLDRTNGKIQARFPGATTPGVVNALPSPRGLGRGAISGDQLLWPTAGEIFIFSARLPIPVGAGLPAPNIVRRIRIDARGSDGGNIIVTDGRLIYASPSRVLMFDHEPDASDKVTLQPMRTRAESTR